MPKTKHTTSQWREFEKLVALLESHLVPRGATIRSPDHIPDKITGEPREVDISVRYQVGSVPILITIECRKREATQDTTWIEQLAQKRNDIGASVTVAVSSRRFTKPAIKKARFYNIETRLLKEVSEEAIKSWARGIDLGVVRGKFGMGRLGLRFRGIPVEQSPSLTQEIINEYAKGDAEYKFIRRLADNQMISIADLLREHEQKLGNRLFDRLTQDLTIELPPHSRAEVTLSSSFPSLFEDVPINGEPSIKLFSSHFEPHEATIDTILGSLEIEYLEAELPVIQQVYPSQIGRLLSYANNEGSILKIEEHIISLENKDPITVIVSSKNDISGQ